jgi:hypothetical protein
MNSISPESLRRSSSLAGVEARDMLGIDKLMMMSGVERDGVGSRLAGDCDI